MKKYLEKTKHFIWNLITNLTSGVTDRSSAQELVITFGGLAIIMLVVLVISFAKPVTEQLNETLFIEHHGAFSYQADADPGVYDRDYAQTGEPFFWDISQHLHVEFSYHLNGINLRDYGGTYQMTARIEDEHGWQRTLVAGDETTFNSFPTTFELDLELDQIAEVLNAYQRKTGISRSHYFLVIEPFVYSQGKVGGMDIQSEFSPELYFYITTEEFYLVSADPLTLNPEFIESATQLIEQGGTLGLFNLHVPVKGLRWVSLFLLIISLIFFGVYIKYFVSMLQRTDPEGLAFRYADWIVDVSKKPANDEMILLSDFEDLLKLAEQYELVILHNHCDQSHFYFLKAPEGYFYYQIPS